MQLITSTVLCCLSYCPTRELPILQFIHVKMNSRLFHGSASYWNIVRRRFFLLECIGVGSTEWPCENAEWGCALYSWITFCSTYNEASYAMTQRISTASWLNKQQSTVSASGVDAQGMLVYVNVLSICWFVHFQILQCDATDDEF